MEGNLFYEVLLPLPLLSALRFTSTNVHWTFGFFSKNCSSCNQPSL